MKKIDQIILLPEPPTEANICPKCGVDRGYYLQNKEYIPADHCETCQRKQDWQARREAQLKYIQENIETVLKTAGVSQRYLNAQLSQLDLTKMPEGSRKGLGTSIKAKDSLYLYGMPGTGKTHIAVSVLRQAFLNGDVSAGQARFVCAADMLGQIRSGILTNDMEKRIEDLCRVPLLVLDDLGVEKNSEFAVETLYRIINERYNEERRTIITSNYSPDKHLLERCGSRITSRIIEMCRLVYTGDFDHRRNKRWRQA